MAPLAPPNIHAQHAGTQKANSKSNKHAGAQSLEIVTLAIPNVEWSGSQDIHRINSTISYMQILSFDIQTLSTNGVSGNNDITGLLYVPDLDDADSCVNASAPYVPSNVTRKANLPPTDYTLIGLAPWVSGDCALKYMAAARDDPIRALLFFLPGSNASAPPESDNVVWTTPDNGHYKSQYQFPIYTIPGLYGAEFMNESALYSGNMTEVPNGHVLSEIYASTDYVRLFVDIDIGNTTDLPSLWIFLLVVLGILLAIIGLTSGAMHWLQRRRRNTLRRRVANGEVDLEALGIKRLTVPQVVLNQMPLYTYGTGAPVSQVPPEGGLVEEKGVRDGDRPAPANEHDRPSKNLMRASSYRPTPLSQPTCAICLEDFLPASPGIEGSTVRELPCHHIFHPECVDTFLRDSSSLCPMCKKTALPRGYCPQTITNAMVRRERMVRQLRERVANDPDAADPSTLGDRDLFSQMRALRTRTVSGFSQLRTSRTISSVPITSSQQMQQLGPQAPTTTGTPSSNDLQISQPQAQPPTTFGRREWARRRAEAMLGPRAPIDPDAEEAQRTPGWRKAVRGVFPGFRR